MVEVLGSVELSVYLVPMVAAALAAGGLLVVVYRNREARAAGATFGILACTFVWATADAGRLAVSGTETKILLNNVRFGGASLVGLFVFLFAVEYAGVEDRLPRGAIPALLVIPAVTNVLVWTEPTLHELVRVHPIGTKTVDAVLLGGSFEYLDPEFGAWFWVHTAQNYLLLVVATGLLWRNYRRTGDVGTYRGQAGTVLAAILVPWVINVAFVADVTAVDLTPVGFAVTSTGFALALFRYELLDVVPIARSTAVENVDAGFLVVDHEETIVDVNPAAEELLGLPAREVLDRPVGDIYEDYDQLIAEADDDGEIEDRIAVEADGQRRHYDVKLSIVTDTNDRRIGRAVLFRDVTDRVRRRRELTRRTEELERQNERLEEFASIVSHDLRNPLGVMEGYLPHARETGNEEYFEEIEDSLERMQRIVDETLTMARQGQSVTDPQPVELAVVVQEAWSNVDTREATLESDVALTVRADRDRLLRTFENLFRNSVEHGRPDVRIRVGLLEGDRGFYVEDDGPGIDPGRREEVFEQGFTTAEDGTGFGLSIVEAAVEAHGWSVRVTDGELGGARFEVTGIDRTTALADSDSGVDPTAEASE